MSKNQSLENRLARVVALVVGGFLSGPIGDNVSAFFGSFFPYSDWVVDTNSFWIRDYIPGLIGYSLTGLLLGLTLWLLFKESAKQLLVYLPVSLLLGQWIRSFIAFSARDSADFSPFRVLGYLLSHYLGFELLIIVPLTALVALLYLQKGGSPGRSAFS